jgi:UDP-glucose:(heptosyl)LPS alpha-1,3-glucosyltransferase
MKVGLVRRGYSATGGAEAYLRRFADALLAAGHHCVLFTSAHWPRTAWPHEVYRVGGADSPRAFSRALAKMGAQERCDVLFSLERVGRCDCYRAGDGVHRAWLEQRNKVESGLRSWIRSINPKHRELLALEAELFAIDGARAVIANSRMVRDNIVQHYPAYPAGRIHVVHNGVPPPLNPGKRAAAREEIRRALGAGPGDFLVLFAGSGWERKGLRYAIEAMGAAHLPHATLVVAGRGKKSAFPRSRRTIFLGPVDDMPRQMAAADAFLLPTLYDPFSNASLEAMAAGLPVITTSHNGFAEIIEPGLEGEIVPEAHDVPALANAIRAWSDPGRREAIRSHLVKKAAGYTVEENLRQTLAVLTRV